ncbi:MAG: SMI1/KNR4 family protein [Phycisphaerales bacterium]
MGDLDPLVIAYVDAAVAQLRRLNFMSGPGNLPEAMHDSTIAVSSDWKGWKPIPSTVTDLELDELEHQARTKLPPLYRDFLKYQHFVDLTERGVRFESHLPDRWHERLRKYWFQAWLPERVIGIGLIPFGSETFMDAGPVCFDTRTRLSDGDCPVVFWDHDNVKTPREVQPLFSSSRAMFRCLHFVAQHDVNFTYHDKSDDPADLATKQSLMSEFLELDPKGAGGQAREYWTAWGVVPSGCH